MLGRTPTEIKNVADVYRRIFCQYSTGRIAACTTSVKADMSAKLIEHRNQSSKVLAHLAAWGFSPDVQQRLGAFGVLWGVFESTLEPALWALANECVTGKRPSTDKTSISDWIKELGDGSPKFDQATQDLLRISARAANHLMDYRHALAHGWLIPFPSGATFIRNPNWNGEVRKRPTNDAHVDANLLDMAIDCVWTLCQVVEQVHSVALDPGSTASLIALEPYILRAQSEAYELHHLTNI